LWRTDHSRRKPPTATVRSGSAAPPGQAARVWAQDEMWYSLDGALEGEVGRASCDSPGLSA
jgi:hypothetical protein